MLPVTGKQLRLIYLGADVWRVVGVTQLGGDVKAELLAVLHSCITQPDAQSATLRCVHDQCQDQASNVKMPHCWTPALHVWI